MKRVISRPLLILLSSFVILIAHTFAKTHEGLKNEFAFRRQQHREARRLAGPNPHAQSQPEDFTDSQNWSGALQSPPSAGDKFNGIQAQWVVPDVEPPPQTSGAGFWIQSVWIGIDGAGPCTTAILQGGTFSYIEVDDSGAKSTASSFVVQWFPRPGMQIDSIEVLSGDTVSVSVTATSLSEGTITLNNLSTDETTTVPLSSPDPANNLCGLTAEWIVEDPENPETNTLYPFAQFSTVTLESCKATTMAGTAVDLNGAELWQLTQNNVPLATPTVVSASSMNVIYG